MKVFLIDKDFHGQKNELWDYFTTTADAVKPNGIDQPIKEPFTSGSFLLLTFAVFETCAYSVHIVAKK